MRYAVRVLLWAVLLWATGTQAAEADAFQVLLQHTGLPHAVHPPAGQALTLERAQALWGGLVESPATLGTFAPRTALGHVLREAVASGQPLGSAELQARAARFRPLVVVRPRAPGLPLPRGPVRGCSPSRRRRCPSQRSATRPR
jgi:hypothetical protein